MHSEHTFLNACAREGQTTKFRRSPHLEENANWLIGLSVAFCRRFRKTDNSERMQLTPVSLPIHFQLTSPSPAENFQFTMLLSNFPFCAVTGLPEACSSGFRLMASLREVGDS